MAPTLHPIQLQTIRVKHLRVSVFNAGRADEPEQEVPFSFEYGHSKFDREKSLVTVGVRGTVGESDDDERTSPFVIEAEILGLFKIDLSKFAEEHIERWSEVNAPLILLPFLREHIYGVAARAGIKEVIVPLYILPTVKMPESNAKVD